jgi:multidrug efflux pump subunit AcrA (membrane-fusion protein)
MRGKWILISGIVVFLAVAAGALSLLKWKRGSEGAPAASTGRVEAFTGSEISLPGEIQAQQVVAVGAPVEGTITAILANAGESVFEGQLLAEIGNSSLEMNRSAAQLELERAQAEVNGMESRVISSRLEASRARADASRARSEFERTEKAFTRQQFLLEKGATPRLVYEKARKEYDMAKSDFTTLDDAARAAEDRVSQLGRDLDAAKKTLAAKTGDYEQAGERAAAGQVLSPVDGLVVSRKGDKGETVNPDVQDFFVIAVNLEVLDVVVEPEPPALERIHAGQEAVIQLAEFPGQGIPGQVREVKDGRVIVEFTRPGPEVKPGLTAQVRIKLT